jgi:hypothetical protein
MEELLEQYNTLDKLHRTIKNNRKFPLDSKYKGPIMRAIASNIFQILDEIDAIKLKDKNEGV